VRDGELLSIVPQCYFTELAGHLGIRNFGVGGGLGILVYGRLEVWVVFSPRLTLKPHFYTGGPVEAGTRGFIFAPTKAGQSLEQYVTESPMEVSLSASLEKALEENRRRARGQIAFRILPNIGCAGFGGRAWAKLEF